MTKRSKLMAKNEDPFTEAITKKQLLAMVKCEYCLQHLKDEFLYEHPDRIDIFKNISKLSDDDFELIRGHAEYVLMESADLVMSYGGYYEHLDPYMTINGMRGVYVAWNNDFTGFFTRKRDALAYVGKCYSEFMEFLREDEDD
jgi:hypothetical protein